MYIDVSIKLVIITLCYFLVDDCVLVLSLCQYCFLLCFPLTLEFTRVFM